MKILNFIVFAVFAGAVDGFFGWLLLDHLVHIGYLNWWALCGFAVELIGTGTYWLNAKLK